MNPIKGFAMLLAAIIVIILGLSVVFGSWFTVDEGARAVVLRNGAFARVSGPGLNFKLPIVESVEEFEVRTQKLTFKEIAVYSKDIQSANIYVEVNFRPDASKMAEIYSTLGRGYAERVLWPNVYREIKEVFGKYNAADIINARDRLGIDVTNNLTAAMAQYNVLVEQVQITNVDFSDAFETSIEQRMAAEVSVQKERQVLEQKKLEAERIKVTADAEAYATQKTADAESYRIRETKTAEAEGITKRGAALRANPELVDLVKAERWNGALPTTMVPGGSVPMLSLK